MTTLKKSDHAPVPFWRDERYLKIIIQVIVVALVVFSGFYLVRNLVTGLEDLGIPLSFRFLKIEAQFDIGETLIEYSRTSTYARALLVGILNTIKVSFLGIIFATIFGIIVGIARLSKNWLINKLAAIYVEALRNIPLLVFLIFLSTTVFHKLPRVKEALSAWGWAYLTNRGIYVVWPQPADGWDVYRWFLLGSFVVGLIVAIIKYREGVRTGRMPLYWLWGSVTFILLAGVTWVIAQFIAGQPLVLDFPYLAGRNFKGGQSLSPEFMAIFTGLVIYTSAFIAEIVRAGIQAVSKGQREAATSLGLTGFQTMRLVIFPQALRVIIPPLTSQYLNLTKNSSLAIAVGYPDLFAVGSTIINQAGRAVEIILIMMGVYLTFSLLTSLFMNWYNKHTRLVER
ncbi:MAG TPA: ABC transporter permease subunit [Anaerolineae bacterium]|nr:ABC transporter permease subunit [Anaerolineae bacterium]